MSTVAPSLLDGVRMFTFVIYFDHKSSKMSSISSEGDVFDDRGMNMMRKYP